MARDNVRKRVSPNGIVRFEARWRDASGTQRQQTFRTKQAALKFQAERRVDRLRGLARDEDRASDSFVSYSNRWLDAKRTDVRARTVEGYEKDLRVHVLPFFAYMPVGKITTSDVLRWIEVMKEKRIAGHSLSPRTIQGAFNCLDQVLRLAVLDGALHINVAKGVRLPRYHSKPPERPFTTRTLNPQEQVRLVQAMTELDSSGLDGLVTVTLLQTGLRVAELSGLEIGDVSLLNRTVSVTRTKTYRESNLVPTVGIPKSKRSIRVIPIPQALATALSDWFDAHPRRHEPSAPIFPARTGDVVDWSRPLDPNVFRRVSLWPALAHANLDQQTRLHDLRHTYGTTLVENGAPVEKVSRIMGHSSMHTTMSLYVHLDTAQHHDVVDGALPSLLAPERLLRAADAG